MKSLFRRLRKRRPFFLKRSFRRKLGARIRAAWSKAAAVPAAVIAWIKRLIGRITGRVKHRRVVAQLRKADIILAAPRLGRLTPISLMYRLLLRARYIHSMIYIGGDLILHTTSKDGVTVGRVPFNIHREDVYSIFRAIDLDDEAREKIIEEALKLRGRKLDLAGLMTNVPARLFRLNRPLFYSKENRIWCSKLIYRSFLSAGIELLPAEKAGNITSEDLSRNSRLIRVRLRQRK